MINITGKNVLKVARGAFISLFETNDTPSDPKLLREDVALIHIIHDKSTNWVKILNDEFILSDGYKQFSPFVDFKLLLTEKEYWGKELFGSGKANWLIDYLKKFPLSKRAIILLWKDEYRDLSKVCPCTSSIFFRIKNGKLEMHSTVRANNSSFLLFLDMSFMLAFQGFIAKQLGLESGDYYHFVDSLHFYRSEEGFIRSTYEYLKGVKISNE